MMDLRNSVIIVRGLNRDQLLQLLNMIERNGVIHVSGRDYSHLLSNGYDNIKYIGINENKEYIILSFWSESLTDRHVVHPNELLKKKSSNLINLI